MNAQEKGNKNVKLEKFSIIRAKILPLTIFELNSDRKVIEDRNFYNYSYQILTFYFVTMVLKKQVQKN